MRIFAKQDKIKDLVSQIKITASGADLRRAADLCGPFLSVLNKGDDPEDWMMYTYAFLLARFYPETHSAPQMKEREEAAKFYLDLLNALFEKEQKMLLEEKLSFNPMLMPELPTKEERALYGENEEYGTFLKCFFDDYFYALLRLSAVCTPYTTRQHVLGVHHVAMYIARQLKHTTVQADLTLVSAVALMHDIGKFGCRAEESSRIPHLHYYYTYDFCKRYGMPVIGSLAGNHSVWDLELENFTVENILLIYADFRVKAEYKNGKENMRFWSLDESYQVILDKLENVDEAKKKRYERVYAKLKDFEEFLQSLGVAVDLISEQIDTPTVPYDVLLSPVQMIDRLKFMTVDSSLSVMHSVSTSMSFISLQEMIRSEKDSRHVRAFLTLIDEFSTYLPQSQKHLILQFLSEIISHREGDVRRKAADVAGCIIADFGIFFGKEIPDGFRRPDLGKGAVQEWKWFLHYMLDADAGTDESQRRWAGYAAGNVLRALLARCRKEDTGDIVDVLLDEALYFKNDDMMSFFLVYAMTELSFKECTPVHLKKITKLVKTHIFTNDLELNAAIKLVVRKFISQGWQPSGAIQKEIKKAVGTEQDERYCMQYLNGCIRSALTGEEVREPEGYKSSKLYFENQRTEAAWIHKLINLEILRLHYKQSSSEDRLYQYASHLLNQLQFSERIVNRIQAGRDLTAVMPRLTPTQRFEIVEELVRALNAGEYSNSKYIPPYLGRIIVLLSFDQQEEVLKQLRKITDSTHEKAAMVAIETVGEAMQRFAFNKADRKVRSLAAGILLRALAHFNSEIAQEAFYNIGHDVFGSRVLSQEHKRECFVSMAKKLVMYSGGTRTDLSMLYHAASINHIYRFLSDGRDLTQKAFGSKTKKVAFFPGTFDPFSLGHKAIVSEIVSKGFEVYLAVDDFSWSKKTQPFETRRETCAMSTADMEDVYLFPEEIPINIANPDSLKQLRDVFGKREVYIVEGSDVISNASAYRGRKTKNSIHTFPHILFLRNAESAAESAEKAKAKIDAPVIILQLPTFFETVSSSRIRNEVSSNRDISMLVDENVQNYIYSESLYNREPAYKQLAKSRAVSVMFKEERAAHGKNAFICALPGDGKKMPPKAEVRYYIAETDDLYNVTGDLETAAALRRIIAGRTAVISSFFAQEDTPPEEIHILLNEMLTRTQRDGVQYAVYVCARNQHTMRAGSEQTSEGPSGASNSDCENQENLLKLHGFKRSDEGEFLVCDMRRPLVLLCDTCNLIKEPFSHMKSVRNAVWEARVRLLTSMCGLYPGELILFFDSEYMDHRLVELVTAGNDVPRISGKGLLGKKMCVPFGKILRDVLIPNTVTKELQTEKYFDIDLMHFSVAQAPRFAPLEVQIRAISKFNRDVILVDDIYHGGFRLDAVRELMLKEGVTIDRLVCGVISGYGLDLARQRGITVDPVYVVPNMRRWLIESEFYPFIGGDGMLLSERILHNPGRSIPSINPILPYEAAPFFGDTGYRALYELSETCINNTRDIFLILESEYEKMYKKMLTLEREGEVIVTPRYPDTFDVLAPYEQLAVSSIMGREREKLIRLGNR